MWNTKPVDPSVAWSCRPDDLVPTDAPLGSVHLDPALAASRYAAPTGWTPRRALLALAVAARTIAAGHLSGQIARWGVGHGLWTGDELASVETALTEALTNAAVHGCLGLPGMSAFQPDPYAYFDAVEAALADEGRGLRPVMLAVRRCPRLVVVHVEDGGSGFVPGSPVAGPIVSGRGLALMRGLTRRLRLSAGGRRTSLGFPHPEGLR